MTLMQWARVKWDGRLPFAYLDMRTTLRERLPTEPTRLEVLACLIALNGGDPHVRGWGVTSGGGLYGHMGVEQEEALTLLEMWAFVSGMIEATGGAELKDFRAAI